MWLSVIKPIAYIVCCHFWSPSRGCCTDYAKYEVVDENGDGKGATTKAKKTANKRPSVNAQFMQRDEAPAIVVLPMLAFEAQSE